MNGGDLTRSTFRAYRHFSGVRMQQGRVQLDADWNEQLDLDAHRERAELLDVVGATGVPKVDGGFRLTASPDGDDLLLTFGRAWVDGHLCELDGGSTAVTGTPSATSVRVGSLVLDGTQLNVNDWVELSSDTDPTPVLARVSAVDVAQRTLTVDRAVTAPAGDVTLRRRASYAAQPDLPLPAHTTQANPSAPRVLALPDGDYLAYLDVWERSVTALDDPALVEPALGGPDTATRSRVVWQLRLLDLSDLPAGPAADCETDLSEPLAQLAASSGRMESRAVPPAGAADLCRPTPAGGYVGLENQLYRVHVHEVTAGRPAILWSRENASVVTSWTGATGNVLEVGGIGRDAVLGLRPGDWVELFDDTCVLDRQPGTLVQLLNATGTQLKVDTTTATGPLDLASYPRNPRVRRWDSAGTVDASADGWLDLEQGVQVRFPAGGTYRRHDYWLVPARSATASVDWPADSGGGPVAQTPAGVRHSVGRLGIVTVSGQVLDVTDCRDQFPALTALTAGDVSVENDVCNLPGVETVQDAIDALCRANDLRRHNRLLHGHGIVCGLAVHCGDTGHQEAEPAAGEPRRFVTVEPGSAIDVDGNDIDIAKPVLVDVLKEVDGLGQGVLDANGDGEVCLVLRTDPDRGPVVAATTYEADESWGFLKGTMLWDIYNDCIADLQDWIRRQLNPAKDASFADSQSAFRLRTVLTNLATYAVNPKSGGTVFVSQSEDKLVRTFYEGLKKRLRSQSFCAMFDNARPYPDYPETLKGIRTISGLGWHSRVRVHPGGEEVYTVGSGVNPLKPASFINRYSLVKETLLARIDPVSGKELKPGESVSSATNSVTDVAFSPDGRVIYAAVPTRDENDTLFLVGDIGETIRWRPAVTICGVKLVTLAVTAADPERVYAVALRRRQGAAKGWSPQQYEGAGIFQITPGNIPDTLGPMPGTETLNTVGHLLISSRGEAVFTCGTQGESAASYNQLVSMLLPQGGITATVEVEKGQDDIALVSSSGRLRTSAVWAIVGSGQDRGLIGYDVRGLQQVSDRLPVEGVEGAISLQPVNGRLVLADTNTSLARVFDPRLGFVDALMLPLQVSPVSLSAIDPRARQLVALNLVSNSLSVIDAEVVMGESFDLAPLVKYRRAAVESFADLLGGFLQYLKDCICDHLLVNCPTRPENTDLDLAAVSIRGGSVYKVCNFSRRHYVKSFPTVGYWMSLVPVLPFLREVVTRVCCTVLPDVFGRYTTANDDTAKDRVPAQQLLRLLEIAQAEDPLSKLRGGRAKVQASRQMLAAGQWNQATEKLGLFRGGGGGESDGAQGAGSGPSGGASSGELQDLRSRLDSLEVELAQLKAGKSAPAKPRATRRTPAKPRMKPDPK